MDKNTRLTLSLVLFSRWDKVWRLSFSDQANTECISTNPYTTTSEALEQNERSQAIASDQPKNTLTSILDDGRVS